jgi:hypothetical protein
MNKRLPERDQIAAFSRVEAASRGLGENKQCECGESRPEALIRGTNPTVCAACAASRRGHTTYEKHHPAGRANNPATIPVPINDHRADLSESQRDWPRNTLENPEQSTLLAAAAQLRGYIDTNDYLIRKLVIPSLEMLETFDKSLQKQFEPERRRGKKLRQFKPKRGSNG